MALVVFLMRGSHHPNRFVNAHAAIDAVRRFGEKRALRFVRHPSMHEGFHAFRPDDTWMRNAMYATKPVLAEVELFGRVIEYERGYRAEKMRIEKLVVHPRFGEAAADLEKRYDCDVEMRAWQTSDERSVFTRSSPYVFPTALDVSGRMCRSALIPSPTAFRIGRSEKKNGPRQWLREVVDKLLAPVDLAASGSLLRWMAISVLVGIAVSAIRGL